MKSLRLICGIFFLLLPTAFAADLAEAEKSIVRIFNMEKGAAGSGFVVSKDGHIGTNCHVVDESATVTVVFPHGSSVMVKTARVICRDVGLDLAIVQASDLPLPPLTLTTALPDKGDDVIALGFPGQSDNPLAVAGLVNQLGGDGDKSLPFTEDLRQAMSIPVKRGFYEDKKHFSWYEAKGVLEKLTREQVEDAALMEAFRADPQFATKLEILQHTAPINYGNSGGPLFDRDFRVIGVNTAGNIDDDKRVLCLSSHISEFIKFANRHNVPLVTTSSKASTPGSMGGAQKALWLAVALFSLVLFLMVLRKPRTIMVDAMSRVVSIGRKSPSPAAHVSPRPVQQVSPPPTHQQPVPAPKPASAPFVLRGRDLQGRSYQLPFSPADFARAGGRLVIGRSHDLCGLCIRHDSISRQHATLTLAGSELRIEDRNSGNGTVVNGRKLIVGTPPVPLRHGDRISLGEVDLVFESAS